MTGAGTTGLLVARSLPGASSHVEPRPVESLAVVNAGLAAPIPFLWV